MRTGPSSPNLRQPGSITEAEAPSGDFPAPAVIDANRKDCVRDPCEVKGPPHPGETCVRQQPTAILANLGERYYFRWCLFPPHLPNMRITFTLLFLSYLAVAHAQVQRGDYIITLNEPRTFSENAQLLNAWDLGQAYYNFSDKSMYLGIGPTYGYALTDRLVLGATGHFILRTYLDQRYGSIALSPYVRYYLLRKSDLGLYAQVSSSVGFVYDWKGRTGISNTGFTGFDVANFRAGLQLPVASGVRLGPVLDYQVLEDFNTLTVGAQIEVVLSKATGDEAGPVATFGAGSVMLGGQLASIGFRQSGVFGSLAVGGYYFLTNRLAGGLSIGLSGSRFGKTFVTKGLLFTSELSARYYLTTGRRLVWYLGAGAGLITARRWYDDSFGTPPSNGTNYAVNASLGGQYFLRDNLALEFGPHWRKVLDDEDSGKYVGLTAGVRFFLR